jgi:hypothetical protein
MFNAEYTYIEALSNLDNFESSPVNKDNRSFTYR